MEPPREVLCCLMLIRPHGRQRQVQPAALGRWIPKILHVSESGYERFHLFRVVRADHLGPLEAEYVRVEV